MFQIAHRVFQLVGGGLELLNFRFTDIDFVFERSETQHRVSEGATGNYESDETHNSANTGGSVDGGLDHSWWLHFAVFVLKFDGVAHIESNGIRPRALRINESDVYGAQTSPSLVTNLE